MSWWFPTASDKACSWGESPLLAAFQGCSTGGKKWPAASHRAAHRVCATKVLFPTQISGALGRVYISEVKVSNLSQDSCFFGTVLWRPCLPSQEDKMSVCITQKLFSHMRKDHSHFNQAPQFSWMDYETSVSPQQISEPQSTLFQLVWGWRFLWRWHRLRYIAWTKMAFSKDVLCRYGVACQHLMNRPPVLINPRSEWRKWKRMPEDKEAREGREPVACRIQWCSRLLFITYLHLWHSLL